METPQEGIPNPSRPDAEQIVEAESSPPPGLPPALPFTSQEPKVGDPPLAWEDFKKLKLRRFPGSRDDIKLRRFLGRGEDGYVVRARIRDREEPVAIKIVRWPC